MLMGVRGLGPQGAGLVYVTNPCRCRGAFKSKEIHLWVESKLSLVIGATLKTYKNEDLKREI